MTRIEASYRLTTPLFCGGATADSAELRLPSFKGVLRFWWRALAWSRLAGDLEAIQQQEDWLFGSAGTGQAQVLMRFGSLPALEILKKDDQFLVGKGVSYLGYGLLKADKLSRAALQAPLEFVVRLHGTRLTADHQASLQQALIALGTLGGMGSRSRRGYGSLALQTLTIDGQPAWSAPRSLEALAAALQGLLSQANPGGLPEFPPYTALSAGSRLVLLSADNNAEPLKLLDRVGREMVHYRSWGKGGTILENLTTEGIFKADHDLMKKDPDKRGTHPQRIAFGLPHNYGKGPRKEVAPADHHDRRASPLLIHIHQCGTQPVAVLSFLPARFLPSQGQARISVGGRNVSLKPEQELYQPIHTFLNRLLDQIPAPHNRKEPFTTAREVKP